MENFKYFVDVSMMIVKAFILPFVLYVFLSLTTIERNVAVMSNDIVNLKENIAKIEKAIEIVNRRDYDRRNL